MPGRTNLSLWAHDDLVGVSVLAHRLEPAAVEVDVLPGAEVAASCSASRQELSFEQEVLVFGQVVPLRARLLCVPGSRTSVDYVNFTTKNLVRQWVQGLLTWSTC